MREILQNAVYLIDYKIFLYSTNTHDFNAFETPDGNLIFVDGGRSYLRRSVMDGVNYLDCVLYSDSPMLKKARFKLWGTRGKSGKEPLTYWPLCTYSEDHLNNIKKLSYVRADIVEVIDFILNNPSELLEFNNMEKWVLSATK